MDMHRAHRQADWEHIDPSEWTVWQQYAARTNGWLTLGNIISFIGLLAVLVGYFLLWNHTFVAGFWWVVLGRSADILDGFVANHTLTKSHVGETLDAGIDKIILFIGIGVFWYIQAVSHNVLILLAVVQVGIAVTSLFARSKNIVLHPSRTGKYSAAVLWLALGSSLLSFIGVRMRSLVDDAFIVAIVMSFYAWITYMRDIIIGGTKGATFDKNGMLETQELTDDTGKF